MASLWLGGIALSGITVKLLVTALGSKMPTALIAAFEAAALFSVAAALGPWFVNSRTKWLTARFMTEQIRQWHFQLLLDGRLVCQAARDPKLFERSRASRWAQFQEAQAANAEGSLTSFVAGAAMDFHHGVAPYDDAMTAEQVVRAYSDLRFQKQLAYFKLKREEFVG